MEVEAVSGDGAGLGRLAPEWRRPLLADIKRNSLDDGPGIRTTIFFKGCPLRCVWCHNPETKDPGPEVMRSDAECLRCGACVEVCPTGAMRWPTKGSALLPPPLPPAHDRDKCKGCGRCTRVCPGRGVSLVGRYREPEEVAHLVALDLPFYRNSGGGVTLSGGEPTLYPLYLERLLIALEARGVPVLLETCGYFGWNVFRKRVLRHLKAVYFDLKLADPEEHRRFTGRDNRLVLANLERLAEDATPELLVRVPLVPGMTATDENLRAIAGLLRRFGVGRVALLPYNPLWLPKAEGLGHDPLYRQGDWMSPQEIQGCREAFAGFQLVE